MKTLVFGDIHGRTIWRDIIDKEKENLGRVIFLGDYVSTHENISEEDQIKNLKDILDYKESCNIEVILLRGNHDMEALGYSWAECYPVFRRKDLFSKNNSELKNRFLTDTQWTFVDGDVIYSHAGISREWFSYLKKSHENIESIEDINQIEPCEDFGFSPGPDNIFDTYGDSIHQTCTWIRPTALLRCAVDGTHVVGHTTVVRLSHLSDIVEKQGDENTDIWLCDALGERQYLVVEDGKFEVKQLNK